VHAAKTRMVDATAGFDFLGRHLRLKPLRIAPQRRFCSRWPSTRAMHSMRHQIRDAIGYDDRYSLEETMRAINPLLRGWGQSFRHSNAQRHFKKIDSLCLYKMGQGSAAATQTPRERHDCAYVPHAARCTWSESRMRAICMSGLLRGRWKRSEGTD
jgi:hypothetical protein